MIIIIFDESKLDMFVEFNQCLSDISRSLSIGNKRDMPHQ